MGLGFVLAFNTPKVALVAFLYAIMAIFFGRLAGQGKREQLLIMLLGTVVGVALSFLDRLVGLWTLMYILGGLFLVVGFLAFFVTRLKRLGWWLFVSGALCLMYNLVEFIAGPIATFSRSMTRGFWSNAIFQFSDYMKGIFQIPPMLLGALLLVGCAFLFGKSASRLRIPLAVACLALPCAMIFTDNPMAG